MVADSVGSRDGAPQRLEVGSIAVEDGGEVFESPGLGSGFKQQLSEVQPNGNGCWIALDGGSQCREQGRVGIGSSQLSLPIRSLTNRVLALVPTDACPKGQVGPVGRVTPRCLLARRYLSLTSFVAALQSKPQTNALTAASPALKLPGTNTIAPCFLSLQVGANMLNP